ncbi:MAG: hypothetical protein AB7Q29_14225, partial [Vicinamibacterales bacterium]
FIQSAGGWSHDGRQLAVGTVVDGRPAIAIFNAPEGERVRDLRVEEADEIFSPTWSPDDRFIAFTGMTRGLTDLFIVDVESGKVRQVTQDPFADLHPSWSPDGTRIAIATDRFSTRLDQLAIGEYRVGFVDPQSGRVSQAPSFTTGKNINPQWSPDGRMLYFISDRAGIPNVYRMSADAGADVAAITDLSTGISGITSASPALSVAASTGMLAVSVYDEGRYDIYTIPPNPPAVTARIPGDAAVLPPQDRRASEVQQLLANAAFGLPPGNQNYDTRDYSAGLHLEALGQPTVGFGVSRYGATIGGGISASFSDMLGNHTLTTAFQVNSGLSSNYSFKNTAAQVLYMNQAHRWNWGLIGSQVPYLSGGTQRFLTDVEGEPAILDETTIFRQTERTAGAVVAYPFSKAQRIEFQAGATQLSFDQIVRTEVYSRVTGQLFFQDSQEMQVANSLTLATTSAALVYDTSNFGATSPVLGQRYRFEATPTFGTINYTNVLADYRRYFMPFRFYTLAGRILHYGRYGSGGEDSRLFPLFIGYPTLVRGYDINSITADECGPTTNGDCPAFSRLLGSRMLVANLEFRFPLLRPFTGASRNMYGPVPAEVGFFLDGGVAWNRGERPALLGGERQGVSSTGVTLRTNLFGFAVGQFDFSRPLHRTGKGWIFQFNLSPGF